MRSIRYIFGGEPHNMDDCIDLVRNKNEKILNVSVDLKTEEFCGEITLFRQLIGIYRWTFPDKNVRYENILGACVGHESEKRQMISVDNANKRLEDEIKLIETLGVKVERKNFDYSAVYRAKVKT